MAASPSVVLSTVGPEGLDGSPRGDPPGFVEVSSDGRTLHLPDRLGNNCIDGLRDIVRDDRVASLFPIPGIGETLRVNGRDRGRRGDACALRHQRQATALGAAGSRRAGVFQCQKALVRSGLWKDDAQIDRSAPPSTGTMLAAPADAAFDGVRYDREHPERMARTIY